MSIVCNTGAVTSSAPASRYVAQLVVTNNNYSGAIEGIGAGMYSYWGLVSATESNAYDGASDSASDSWTGGTGNDLEADVTYKYQAYATGQGAGGSDSGNVKNKKTGAVAATASTPTSSSVTSSTATIQCAYYPNVRESTCSAQLQYKRSVDSTWTNAGTAGSTGGGTAVYTEQTESENITGLTGSTQYNVRLVLTRTTTTGTSAWSRR